MARVAGSGSRHVTGRFPSRLNSVVTAHAGAGDDAGMSKDRPGPGDGTMATIAGHRRGNVRRGLTLHRAVVVALGAGPRRHAVVCEKGRLPVGRAVTAVAVDRRRQVIGRLEGRDHAPARRVTLETLGRRSAKQALQVAPFALHLGMPAAERKPGRRVIQLHVGAVASLSDALLRKPQFHGDREQRGSERKASTDQTNRSLVRHDGKILREEDQMCLADARIWYVISLFRIRSLCNEWEINPKHGI